MRAHNFATIVNEIRSFNRFYTRQMGLLEDGILKSGFTLAEARILFELGSQEPGCGTGVSSSILVSQLGLGPGYLSRIVKKLEAHGLVVKRRSAVDGRQIALSLSVAGQKRFEELDQASRRDMTAMVAHLDQRDCEILVRAMQMIELIIAPQPDELAHFDALPDPVIAAPSPLPVEKAALFPGGTV